MKIAKQHVSNHVSSKLIWTWLVAAVLLQLCCVAAYGQDKNAKYETLEFANEFKMIKTDRSMTDGEVAKIKKENRTINSRIKSTKSKLSKALRSGTDASMQSEMGAYINGYMFPLLTQTDELSLSRLGAGREFFLKNFVIGKARDSRARVIENYILPQCKNILAKNFHPAVRMNAIVMLGLLNNAEAKSGQAPVLTGSAFPIMKSVLTGDSFPDYLKVGALAGIQRHIEVSNFGASNQVSTSNQNEISTYCLAVLKDGQKGQDKWSSDIDYWMKRRSVQILGAIGEPTPEVLDIMLTILKTEPAEGQRDNFWVRSDALVAMGSFEAAKIASGKIAEVMDGVTGFTAVALRKEADFLTTTVDDLVRSNILFADKDLVADPTRGKKKGGRAAGRGAGIGGDGGGGGFGGRSTDDEDEDDEPTVELPNFQLNASRQRIKIVLNSARNAFTRDRAEDGLLKVAGDKASQIDSIIKLIDDLLDKSEYGLIDRGDGDAETPKNVTDRLVEDYRIGSNQMKDLMLTKMVDDSAPADAEGSMKK